MAAIDKIYGTQKQYLELKNWLLDNQKPIRSQVGWSSDTGDKYDDVLPTDCLYDEDGYNKEHRPISNFGIEIDEWLIKNCPLDFVQEAIKNQYTGLESDS